MIMGERVPNHHVNIDVLIAMLTSGGQFSDLVLAQIQDADSKTKDPRKHGSGNTNNAPGSQIHNDETYQAES